MWLPLPKKVNRSSPSSSANKSANANGSNRRPSRSRRQR
jgi:hypothetical protein